MSERYERAALRLIGQLLHDATLRSLAWERAAAGATLTFECLR